MLVTGLDLPSCDTPSWNCRQTAFQMADQPFNYMNTTLGDVPRCMLYMFALTHRHTSMTPAQGRRLTRSERKDVTRTLRTPVPVVGYENGTMDRLRYIYVTLLSWYVLGTGADRRPTSVKNVVKFFTVFVHNTLMGPRAPIASYLDRYRDELSQAGFDSFPETYDFTSTELCKLYNVFCSCMGISCRLPAKKMAAALHIYGAVLSDAGKTVFKPVYCQEFIKLVEAAHAGFRTCSLCESQAAGMLRCGGCKQVCYCNKECQRRAWPVHKQMCAEWSQSPSGTIVSAEEAELDLHESLLLSEKYRST